MLIVLMGDGLGVLVSAIRILELLNRFNVRILIIESPQSEQMSKMVTGPLPHCITAVPPNSNAVLEGSALNHANSSVMFLSSIHRAPKNARSRKLEKPMVRESLIVTPCTHSTNAILYHPHIYLNYLKSILRSQKNVSFALVNNSRDLSLTLHHLTTRKDVFIFNFKVSQPNLSNLGLSEVHWDGVPNWKMPEVVHWLRRQKQDARSVRVLVQNERQLPTHDILTNFTFYDLGGAIITANTMIDYMNALLIKASLRLTRL